MTPPVPIGVIHGRFQVLHNDQLRYLLAGRARCRHLVVGVTNPDPGHSRPEAADPNRSDPAANPLTYFERQAMVRAALTAAGTAEADFTVVPFPVSLPALYRYYVPLDALFFLTIYDAWGRRKREYFESLGLRIEVLWDVAPEQKGLSGTDVRRCMASGGPWKALVPPAVATLAERWDLPARLAMAGG
ncbi:nicotinate-nucleotide adenylyltransferase [Solidesulfovibrio sp.]|uniref:nicotinate-nucleotide adenylyltransferase n=1 Tax=Solidesulfovibrio sp. TaxID=2910990 RepID=UPI002B1F5914|nr:nicotinate-nucleotide adenylyltransferase [Solidesulfovibrio sp.]MEA4856525.1 nicotinate-nucleotide adenylyltransferase [Solidesulfovibrio sp.]